MGIGYDGEKWDIGREVLKEKGYLCGRLLGRGAFSRVYYVEDENRKETFACKVSGNMGLLEKEAGILAGLCHPLFPKCFGMWQEACLGFLLMEYVPGSNMEEMLIRRGGFSWEQVVRTGMELAEGLRYLHERPEKLLFRDVKPANIMIRQDGRIKLLDFGCVCTMGEAPGAYAGSPGYAAPEQLRGGGILTAASDVYGLGQTMKRMLGADGRKVSKKRRPGRSLGKRRRRKALMHILDVCTRQESSERIPDMRGVMKALIQLEGGKQSDACLKIIYQKNVYEPDSRK